MILSAEESNYSYEESPLFDVTIEEFETCALDRLRILAEIESSSARNRTWAELAKVTDDQCRKYLPLDSTPKPTLEKRNLNPELLMLDEERRRDHLSHFVLRLAFCRSCVACHSKVVLH